MSSSSRRRRTRRSPLSPAPGAATAAPPAADEHELVTRLRALLPPDQAAASGNGKAASRARVLREACVYIRRLHAEVDGAAERLAARLLEDSGLPPAAADDDASIPQPMLMM